MLPELSADGSVMVERQVLAERLSWGFAPPDPSVRLAAMEIVDYRPAASWRCKSDAMNESETIDKLVAACKAFTRRSTVHSPC